MSRDLLLSCAFLALLAWPAAANEPGGEVAAASCLECHDAQAATHARGPHAGASCASCHGGAAEHLADPSAENAPVEIVPASCLTCHQGGSKQMHWSFSDHERAGVQCRDCHGIHSPRVDPKTRGGLMIKDATAALCVSCHQEILTRLNMVSHHPIREGGLTCTSCHNPHGSQRLALQSETQACTSCHQSVRGPHAFEHPPAAEGCVSCHNPHGSPSRKLLQAAQPMLCQQCHSIADNRHGQTGTAGSRIGGAALRSCTSCHSAVHGSSFDQHLRF